MGQGRSNGRLPGCRVKHRLKANWLEMVDKDRLVPRVETVINEPDEFRVRRRVRRGGRRVTAWVPLRKSVATLFRYREISLQSNARDLNALAQVDSDLRTRLDPSAFRLHDDPRKRSAQVSRLLHRLHVYRLVAKIPRSRRWRVTDFGWRVMSTALQLRYREFPAAFAAAA